MKPNYKLGREIICEKCGEKGKYWHGHLRLDKYKPSSVPKMCLGIICFQPHRLKTFLEDFSKHPPGIDVDVYFVHNAFEVEGIKNRFQRSQDEIKEIRRLLSDFKWPGKVIIERENVGEDLGAAHFLFNLLKDRYEYFFFLNEAARIVSGKWLKPFLACFERSPKIIALGPKVLKKKSEKYKYILCCTYWGLRASFGKQMKWPAPTNRFEAKAQEMELIWPQAQERGFNIAQIGKGDEWLHYDNVKAHQTAGDGLY